MSLTDTYISYRLIKLLSTQFKKWNAYKLGLIDEEGNILRTPETRIEKRYFSNFERIVRNIKRAITKLTGHSRAAAILSTIVLLKDRVDIDYKDIYDMLLEEKMPTKSLESLAKKAGINVDEAEKRWKKAKSIAKKEYPDVDENDERYWKIVMGIFKKSLGLKEESIAAALPIINHPINMKYPDGQNNGIPYFNVDIDEINIPNILNGRGKYKRWRRFIEDKGIHMWANKNFKPFSIRTKNGIFFRMR